MCDVNPRTRLRAVRTRIYVGTRIPMKLSKPYTKCFAMLASRPTGERPTDEPRRQGSAMINVRPAIHPATNWTPEAAASFVAWYDTEVSDALTRLQGRLEAEHPQGWVFV